MGKSRERRVWPIFRLAENISSIRRDGVTGGRSSDAARGRPMGREQCGSPTRKRHARCVWRARCATAGIKGCGALNDFVAIKNLYQNTGVV